jgi:PAS domain S-box-containing protein
MRNDYLNSLFKAMFDHPSFGASVNDDQTRFILVNQKFCEMIGYSKDELLGKTPFEFTIEEDLEKSHSFHHNLDNMDLSSGEYIKRYRKKDGSVLWAKIIVKKIEDEEDSTKSISVALIEDLTEFQEQKMQADFTQMQLNTILDTTNVGVWCVNKNWKIVYSNNAFQKMLGFTNSQMLNLNLRDITHSEDLVMTNAIFDNTGPGENYQAQRRYLKADGEYLWVRLNVSKFPTNSNNFYGLSLVEDISAQKKLENIIQSQNVKMLASAKMAALGEMAGGIAHEINNPLSIIVGKLNQVNRMLEEPNTDVSRVKNNINHAIDTATRIASVVSGLKTFSRDADNDPFVSYSIRNLISEVQILCEERFKAHGISLSFSCDLEDAEEINCRPTQIVQVIISLLSNSFEAVETLPEKWVALEVTSQNKLFTISITDSGNGIGPDIVAKIMQPFFTTKEIGKGTGLGLSIALGIIEEHKGMLRYDSTSKNTRFIIELPAKI